ncbi:hypothetical protein Ddye_029143 [Dipteronia dyeriana]|uniref:MULE transposase domain-containing protein n=1 Tax=Dipteronia dyeriana TaxID=168575 RepID=A0AAD9WKD2_9ROSI|nr:hypothetical protein Ddye_029143 [Dipteronia dyeriana]
MPYIPVPLTTSSFDIPNPQSRFITDLNEVDFSRFEETIFYTDGDNDDVGENEHVGVDELGDQIDLGANLGGDYGADLGLETDEMGEVPDLRELTVIPEVPKSVCEMPDEIGDDSKLALVTKSNPFKKFIAQKRGFLEGCRPFIGIDGCHLKGPYGCVILPAVALDANSGLYPLAYCICKGETLLSWSWFLWQLLCFLKYPKDIPICFMSDMQKGVIRALKIHHFGVNGNQCSLEEFVDPALSKAAYLRTCDYMIHPIPDLCVWGDPVGAPIQPPPLKRNQEGQTTQEKGIN